MPNLFPQEQMQVVEPAPPSSSEVAFGRSWRFDYEIGDFAITPAGAVAGSTDTDAWIQWCRKAMATERYRYLVYSRSYGQEFDDLIARNLSRAANESEIRRIATETLMTDPRTAGVDSFAFRWEDDRCFFSCLVTSVRGETGTIQGSVVNT